MTKEKQFEPIHSFTINKNKLYKKLKEDFPLLQFRIEHKENIEYTYMCIHILSYFPYEDVLKLEKFCYEHQNFQGDDVNNKKHYKKTGYADFIDCLGGSTNDK